MNYIMRGIQTLKESFFLGVFIYIAIIALLFLFKKAQKTLMEMHF